MKKQTKKSSAKSSSRAAAPKVRAAPVSVSRTTVGKAPRITQTSTTCRIRHRELFCDVRPNADPTVFEAISVPINPGIAAMFPWLHDVANRWEMYRFHKLKFEYISACSTSLGGRVTMAIDFDALDQPPPDKFALSGYSGVTSVNLWDHACLVAPPQNLGLAVPQRYTRRGQRSDLDLKLYDVGNLIYAVHDYYTDADRQRVIGELWVEYDIELYVPQIRVSSAADSLRSTVVGGLGSEQIFLRGAAAKAGSGILQLVTPDDMVYSDTYNIIRLTDDLVGFISFVSKGITSYVTTPGLHLSVLVEALSGNSSVTEIYANLSSTTASKDYAVNLKRGCLLKLQKLATAVLTGMVMWATQAPGDVLRDVIAY